MGLSFLSSKRKNSETDTLYWCYFSGDDADVVVVVVCQILGLGQSLIILKIDFFTI